MIAITDIILTYLYLVNGTLLKCNHIKCLITLTSDFIKWLSLHEQKMIISNFRSYVFADLIYSAQHLTFKHYPCLPFLTFVFLSNRSISIKNWDISSVWFIGSLCEDNQIGEFDCFSANCLKWIDSYCQFWLAWLILQSHVKHMIIHWAMVLHILPVVRLHCSPLNWIIVISLLYHIYLNTVPAARITLGQHKSDNSNRMIQLTNVFCILFRYNGNCNIWLQ